jgi:hypothetical protein
LGCWLAFVQIQSYLLSVCLLDVGRKERDLCSNTTAVITVLFDPHALAELLFVTPESIVKKQF